MPRLVRGIFIYTNKHYGIKNITLTFAAEFGLYNYISLYN
jgi:hypothetical protein